ncbi:MAG: amino acid adenylation domain-containing protein [Eubacteriales bacterium]
MKNVLEMLENTAARLPEAPAVTDMERTLTWSELLHTAQRVGSALAGKLSGNEPVAVCAEKSALTLAAQLGVVYAGGFYVPVSSDQPADRVKKILTRLKTKLVIAEESQIPAVRGAGFEGEILTISDMTAGNEEPDRESLRRIREHASPDDLLYGIFTSGSTGEPKCVSVSHRSVIDFISHFTEIFQITERDRLGNQAPFDFDVSVKDIYSCLLTGAELVIIDRRLFSMPAKLIDYLNEKKVTVLIWAVSALTTVTALKGLDYGVPEHARLIMFSGEAMPAGPFDEWRTALPETEFVNLYGPSEITCNCTYYRVGRDFEKGRQIPIGKPFPGRRIFLLDEHWHEITEAGQTGEICVAGESVAAGYYNDPERTQKSFVQFAASDGSELRMYMTGDLAKYDEDGNLIFCGRKDFQIKLFGHRIELEEIEKAIAGTEGVSDSCCVFTPENSRITAFYTGTADAHAIRETLVQEIPRYMLPRRFIRLESFPVTKNGKKDRNELRSRALGRG